MSAFRAARLAAILLAFVWTGSGVGQAQTHIRESLQEFVQDQGKLISLIRGVAVMKQRNGAAKDSKEYRMSWEYWAAIHGYPGPTSPTGTIAQFQQRLADRAPQDAPLFAGFFTGLQDMTPPENPPGVAEKVWATCKHSTQAAPALHFLSWHRMYLYFFERVLREASGDPNFARPYWDYTNATIDPAQPANAPSRIPTIFALDRNLNIGDGPIPNPLFERRRTAGFGNSVQVDAAVTNIDATLLLDEFLAFQASLEGQIHGLIHCAVGNRCLAPYVGLVPFSANDPVFWHHHANIDRLWNCWTARHGRDGNPIDDPAWMDEEFFFVDENGELVSMKVAELFDPQGRIDYAYDNEADCFRTPPEADGLMASSDALTGLAADDRTVTEVAAVSDVAVTGVNQAFALSRPSEAAADALFLAMRPTIVAPTRAVLTLEDVQTSGAPGASASVYLAAEGGGVRAFVGIIGFFALFEHADHSAGAGRDLSFDVSAQLQQLSADGSGGDDISVVLAASSGLVGDAAPVGEETYSEAGLTIGKISLEVESGAGVIDLR